MKANPFCILSVTLLFSAACGPDTSDLDDQLEPGETLLSDSESLAAQAGDYSSALGVSTLDATARLQTLDQLHGALDALETSDPQLFADRFAGAQVSHEPFAITVRFVGPVPEEARAALAPLGSAVTIVEGMKLSKAQLREAMDELIDRLAAQYPQALLTVAADDGALVVKAAGLPPGAAAGITSPLAPVTVLEVSEDELPTIDDGAPLEEPVADEDAATADATAEAQAAKCPLRGGETLDVSISANCTSGFGATYCFPRGPLGCRPALIAAAHCANKPSYPHCSDVKTLVTREALLGPHGDWQSMTGKAMRKSTKFRIKGNGTYATVRGRVGSISKGDVFHKYGRTSGNTWGEVIDADLDAKIKYTFGTKLVHHLVQYKNPKHGWVSKPGDSGGPVYAGSKAAGITTGGSSSSSLFSPMRDMEKSLPNTFLNVKL